MMSSEDREGARQGAPRRPDAMRERVVVSCTDEDFDDWSHIAEELGTSRAAWARMELRAAARRHNNRKRGGA